jgi:adenosylmethionine-8-amino-7-oxononanoate aminotransferase
MVVQVTPLSWTAECKQHGVVGPDANRAGDDVLARDSRHVWHPYAPMPAATLPYVVDSAEGVRLKLRDGRELVDGMSSWWAAIHGYRHPVLDAAVTDQLGRMAHVMFGGLTHEPAVGLATRLATLAPAPLDRVFLCDSGSVAVEVAIKLALQYWQAAGRTTKRRLLALRGGYHGDTFAAMSVCDPVNGMHHLFDGVLPQQIFAPMPPPGVGVSVDESWVDEVTRLFAVHADELAAVIAEPVVQGAGGMRFYDPGYVAVLRRLCDEHEVLLLLDEIATGFGRTGELFATTSAGVTPDIMCVGKALTGGYLSLAAMMTTTPIAATATGGAAGALLHGPTFMGNPLACAVASANLDLLTGRDWQREVRAIEHRLLAGLEPARDLPGVSDVRVLGAIGVVQLDGPVDVTAATQAAVDRGVWLRPFRDLIYTMPPYICTPNDIDAIAEGVLAATKAGAA